MSTATEPAQPKTVRISSPASLLAAVPPLLGFEPHASMVVIGTVPPRSTVSLILRYDLPSPGEHEQAAEIARHAAGVLAAQGIETAFAVGYGPGDLVTPAADAIRERLPEAGIAVAEALRAEDGRYWSYACTSPQCCPAEGTPFDPGAHPAARALGAAPVLASRESLGHRRGGGLDAGRHPPCGAARRGPARPRRGARQAAFRAARPGGRGPGGRLRLGGVHDGPVASRCCPCLACLDAGLSALAGAAGPPRNGRPVCARRSLSRTRGS